MSNRKLNPMRSTLPGPSGKSGQGIQLRKPVVKNPTPAPKPVVPDVSAQRILITLGGQQIIWTDATIVMPKTSKKDKVAMEKQRIAIQRERKERERLEAERQSRLELALKVATEEHSSLMDEAGDETLKIVLEMHKPYLYEWGWSDAPQCTLDDREWPCHHVEVIRDSLMRRRATDPFMEQVGVSSLVEGAL